MGTGGHGIVSRVISMVEIGGMDQQCGGEVPHHIKMTHNSGITT
jgi:hypothetical protein